MTRDEDFEDLKAEYRSLTAQLAESFRRMADQVVASGDAELELMSLAFRDTPITPALFREAAINAETSKVIERQAAKLQQEIVDVYSAVRARAISGRGEE